jgi:hypothetical protein
MTPLMMADASGFQQKEAVRLLIAAGSDVNGEAKDRQTLGSEIGNAWRFELLAQPAISATTL